MSLHKTRQTFIRASQPFEHNHQQVRVKLRLPRQASVPLQNQKQVILQEPRQQQKGKGCGASGNSLPPEHVAQPSELLKATKEGLPQYAIRRLAAKGAIQVRLSKHLSQIAIININIGQQCAETLIDIRVAEIDGGKIRIGMGILLQQVDDC